MEYIIFPILALILSTLGTYLSIPILANYGVIDKPNERSNHKATVPRGGGVAMIAAILILFVILGVDAQILISILLLASVSLLDDIRGLSVRWRLLAQIIAVTISISALPGRIFPEFVPIILEWVCIGFFWIWFINLTNFMDGIDGITSLQTIMVSLGICLVTYLKSVILPTEIIYASIVAASTLGFFWFNRTPAKLFMGDVGSITLGFLIGYLLLLLAISGAYFSALILPAYYLSDATFTLCKRLFRKEKVWQAHSQHAYQHAVRNGLSHMQVVRKLTFLNIALVILAMLATLNMIAGIISLLLAYAITACFIKRLLNVNTL